MCQLVHVSGLRDETLEILEEEQDENGHLMTAVDADQCEQAWEAGSPEFYDPCEIMGDANADWVQAQKPTR